MYKLPAGGGEATPLARSAGNDRHPAWSPDGRRVAFYSERGNGREQLYAIDVDGQRDARLTTSDRRDWLPAWLPDGEWLVFTGIREDRRSPYAMRADGANERLLVEQPHTPPHDLQYTCFTRGGRKRRTQPRGCPAVTTPCASRLNNNPAMGRISACSGGRPRRTDHAPAKVTMPHAAARLKGSGKLVLRAVRRLSGGDD